ncbi:peptide-binding protein [Sedimentitalea sp. CY04]|uniref:Peptide-binding protein n=1 Tax=Parasedimentitalea denitrificans TaxID=2211118 RepID=A0ABX0W710_9RHOB|nr:SH3 domain-containing protein [Sedimentitalea sp. CY04]NIZ60574.1 peptide-binding protein [Sedimentitalea sp. CY04]
MGGVSFNNYRIDGRILYPPSRISQLECRSVIRLVFILIIGCIFLQPVTAQEYPALHNVTGVADNDVLNIRSQPSASSPIIGILRPHQKSIEIVASDGSKKWGLVNSGEASGWVSLRHMARTDQGDWLDLDNTLSCFGTEPFWSLNVNSSHVLIDMNGEANTYTLRNHSRTSNPNTKTGFDARSNSNPRSSLTGIISAQSCNDGMSDQSHGISVDLMLLEKAGFRVLSGCCSLQP